MIKPNQIRIEGQTSGELILIGEYAVKKDVKSYLEISTLNADGIVVADALLIHPKTKH